MAAARACRYSRRSPPVLHWHDCVYFIVVGEVVSGLDFEAGKNPAARAARQCEDAVLIAQLGNGASLVMTLANEPHTVLGAVGALQTVHVLFSFRVGCVVELAQRLMLIVEP